MRLFTIGFTKKSAQTFFDILSASEAKRVLDVRLNNASQLAGFSKKRDLAYFLAAICGIGYEHVPLLAPTQELLDEYRKHGENWADYERKFLALMRERRIEREISPALVTDACLLCSEERPALCHRRLVAEYLREDWPDVEVIHR